MKQPLSRRALLQHLAAIGALAAFPVGCSDPAAAEEPSIYRHGVASGDPLPDAVILWTRVTSTAASVEVRWEMSTTRDFAAIAASGTATTSAERDYTVKVDAKGLTAGTTYYYRFVAEGRTSMTGRTRTAPAGGVSRLRFGVVSCASLAHGYFHGYRDLATRLDLDAIIHLGDYIYEYGDGEYGEVRGYEPPHELRTLEDYRMRYAQYRRDPDLQAVHRQFPFIAVWDDHETADNSWRNGAENHQPAEDGDWAARQKAAARVYSEWIPIRDQADGKIYRGFSFGDLLDLSMLDSRIIARDEQVSKSDPTFADEARQLLGAEQEAWLAARLKVSTAKWHLLGQQVVVASFPVFANSDAWDGYPASKKRLFDMIESNAAKDVVVLTGDIHMSFAFDLPRDPKGSGYDPATGKGSLGVELVVPGISSPGMPDDLASVGPAIMKDSPHAKFADVNQRGYAVVDVSPERVQSSWYLYTEVAETQATPKLAATLAVKAGEKHLIAATEATPPPAPPGA